MFANRRKKQQLNKTNYYSNRANNLVKANGPVEQLIIYERVDPPVGSIVAYTVNTSPTGWLVCDGSSVKKETYSKLYEVLGNTFGENEEEETFNLPDYRGAFLRGIGTHNGYAGPSNISSYQAHATQTHNHTASSTVQDTGHFHTQPAHAHTATTVITDSGHTHTQNPHNHTATTVITDPGHTHTQTTNQDDYNSSGGNPPSFGGDSGSRVDTHSNINSSTTGITASTTVDNTTATINNSQTGITASTTVNNTTATVNSATTGISVSTTVANSTTNANPTETRPYNYGVFWIIKY